jgi:hypothetical protein
MFSPKIVPRYVTKTDVTPIVLLEHHPHRKIIVHFQQIEGLLYRRQRRLFPGQHLSILHSCLRPPAYAAPLMVNVLWVWQFHKGHSATALALQAQSGEWLNR